MKKLLSFLGNSKGLAGVAKNAVGKISFKRSLPIVIVTYALGKSGIEGTITSEQVWLVLIAAFIYVGGKLGDALKAKYGSGKE